MSLPTWLQDLITQHEKDAAWRPTFTTNTVKPLPVIARYLTVAGAHVVIREIDTSQRKGAVPHVFAECGGCPDAQLIEWRYYTEEETGEEVHARARTEARAWAQAHAETCRAIPMEG